MLKRIQPGIVLLVLWVSAPVADAQSLPSEAGVAKPIGNLIPGIKIALEVKELVEDFTTKQQPPSVVTFLGMARAGGKLEVMELDGEVTVEGSDESIFGTNYIKLRIPCKFRYVVDLKTLKPEDLRYDPNSRKLTVRMPAVQLADPIPDREAMYMEEQRNPFFRSPKSLMKLREQVLNEQLKPNARAKGEEELERAYKDGCQLLQDFLQKVYMPVIPDIKVIVE